MSGEGYIQIFDNWTIYNLTIKSDAQSLRLVVRVATDDDALAIGTLEDNGLQTVLYRVEGKERATRLHEMREVLVGVVLGGVAVSIFS